MRQAQLPGNFLGASPESSRWSRIITICIISFRSCSFTEEAVGLNTKKWPRKGAKSAEVHVFLRLLRSFAAIHLVPPVVYATDFSAKWREAGRITNRNLRRAAARYVALFTHPDGWRKRLSSIIIVYNRHGLKRRSPAMKMFLILGGLILAALPGLAGAQRPGGVFESNYGLTPQNQNPIDNLVFARLKELNIQPARVCSDAVFVRRVYLDVIGTLPKGYEAEQFLVSADPNKRRALIDRLLERSEFADYWAMKWSDLLRIKAEFPINLWPNAAQAYHHWIRTSIRDNLPYDQLSANCSPPAAAISASRRSISTAPCRAGTRRHRPHRCLDIHGDARRKMAHRPAAPAWPPSSPKSATSTLRSGRRRLCFSIIAKPPTLLARTPVFPDGDPRLLLAGPRSARGLCRLAD